MTGASSFTGAWFASALLAAGHEVVALARRDPDAWEEARRRRLAFLAPGLRVLGPAPFGSRAFLHCLDSFGPFDLLALHGAEAGDHRSPRFDVAAAVAANTRNLDAVLERAAERGTRAVLVTGSLFEAEEGDGERPLRPFNPYGRAKTLTWRRIREAATARGLVVGKFTLGHPVGPGEKPGLVRTVLDAWQAGELPHIRHPHLVRDFQPVDRLARAYADFAARLPTMPAGTWTLCPSGWTGTLEELVERIAVAMRPRLARPCRFTVADPPEPTTEPVRRTGLHPLRLLVPDWDEGFFFDRWAAAVRERAGRVAA